MSDVEMPAETGSAGARTMRAVTQDGYGDVDVLHLREVPIPEPGPDQVLVRVHAAGVDPGVWHTMAGLPYLVRVMGYGLRTPKHAIPGIDVAGRVEAVGAEVTGIGRGDEVFGAGQGTFAEYAVVPEDRCVPKPARLSFEQAGAVAVSGVTALQALRRGRIEPGHRVLVIGAAGGVGTYAVQLAKASGAEVTGVCSTEKMDLVRSLGADHVVDYTRDDLGDRRHDLVLDIAGRRPLRRLLRALDRGGTLVIVGGEGGGRWTGGFIGRNLRALVVSPFVGRRLRGLVATVPGHDLRTLRDHLEEGTVTPVIGRTFPLAEAAAAVRHIHEGRARGKVVVTP